MKEREPTKYICINKIIDSFGENSQMPLILAFYELMFNISTSISIRLYNIYDYNPCAMIFFFNFLMLCYCLASQLERLNIEWQCILRTYLNIL
jgi:hypothetical protein